MSWRKLAAEERWSEIDAYRIPVEELDECLALLATRVPVCERGDGVEVYSGYINPEQAQDMKTYYAANLLRDIQRRYEEGSFRDSTEELLRKAAQAACAILRNHGITFNGMQNTYFFQDDNRELQQLDSHFGSALQKRDRLWFDEAHFTPGADEEARRRLIEKYVQRQILYPWRRNRNMQAWHRARAFPENSDLEHAINLLDCYEGLQEILMQEELNMFDVMEVADLSFVVGREFEAIQKKPFEAHALRGIRTQSAASKGGVSRGTANAETRHSILKRMRRLIEEEGLSVSRAGELVHKQGLGSSAEANRKLWNRKR